MFKYFHILKFLMTHDLKELKEFWIFENMSDKKFRWDRIFRQFKKCNNCGKYIILWRLISFMHENGNKKQKQIAYKMQDKLILKYGCEIMLGAKIGKGLKIYHLNGIVITRCVIGENFHVRQNTTIGVKTLDEYSKKRVGKGIFIGDNVNMGANCCVIGDDLTIGSNVIIGATSFIDKNIPDNCTVYTKRINKIEITSH